MRKLFILFSVLLILLLSVAPAFADGQGSGSLLYSPLPFDSVYTGSNYTTVSSWIGNKTKVGNFDFSLLGYGGLQTVYSSSDANFSQDIEFGANSTYCRLYASDIVVNNAVLSRDNSFVVQYGIDGELEGSISFSGNVVTMELQNNEWVGVSRPFSGNYAIRADDLFQLGQYISSSIGALTGLNLVRITDFTVNMSITELEPGDNPYFNIRTALYTSIPSVSQWLQQFDLQYEKVIQVDPADPTDVNLVDWLRVSIGAFLDFELWPGMSLSQIFKLIVVIGLVFWLITLAI